MKKVIAILVMCCAMLGCASSVKTDPVHGKLLGSWELKVDAYVIRFDDELRRLVIVPCAPENSIYLPNRNWKYDESAIGREGDGTVIVGGIRRGQILTVVDVLKDSHPTMGVSYHPIATVGGGSPLAGRKLDAELLYSKFYSDGILNPAWAGSASSQRSQ